MKNETEELPRPTLRLAVPDDAEQLAHLRIQMQGEVNRQHQDNAPAHDGAFTTIHDYFLNALATNDYTSAVAVVKGKLVAVSGVTFYQKPPGIHGGSGIVGYVTNVYTAPEWRGQGLATTLMQMLIDEANRRQADRLHLGASPMGKAVYERIGFTPVRNVALELRLKD